MLVSGPTQADDVFWVETDGLVEAASLVPLPCRLISDLAWTEIGTAEHLARAREAAYPKLI